MVLFLLQVAAPHVLEQEGLGHVDAGESLAEGVRLLSVDIRHELLLALLGLADGFIKNKFFIFNKKVKKSFFCIKNKMLF